MAALLALLVSFLTGPWLIRALTRKQIGQQIRDDGPASHSVKAGTPTMGGALILLALTLATLLLADLANPYVWIALLICLRVNARINHGPVKNDTSSANKAAMAARKVI